LELKFNTGRLRDYEKNEENPMFWQQIILFISTTHIKKGEELFFSYGFSYWLSSMMHLLEVNAIEKLRKPFYELMKGHFEIQLFLKEHYEKMQQ